MRNGKMGHKFHRISSGSSSSAIATVLMRDDRPGKVCLKFDDGSPQVVLKQDNCPKNIRPGTFMVRLTEHKDKMYSLYPASGMFDFTVDSFVAEKEKPPRPMTNQQWDYQYFVVLLRIVKGEFKGMLVPYLLRYNFGEFLDDEDKSVVGITHPRSKYTPQLEEFLEISGAMEKGDIKYTDNILPILQKRILEQARTFKGIIKGGYINTLYSELSPKQESDETDPATGLEVDPDDDEKDVRSAWSEK